MKRPLVDTEIPENLAGERLDRALAALTPGLSRVQARELITGGSVFVDRRRARRCSHPVAAGQHLTCWELHEGEPMGEPRLLVETPDLLVVDKPAGMAVEPTRSGSRGTLIEWLRRKGVMAGVAHRLDAPTSGAIVLARTPAALSRLNAMLAAHEVTRRYLAAVSPAPEWDERTLDAPVEERPARTHARVLERVADAALLALELETGRSRQIRRHLELAGTRVVGDRGAGGRPAPRLLLHASSVELEWDGRRIAATAVLPQEYRDALASLGLHAPQDVGSAER